MSLPVRLKEDRLGTLAAVRDEDDGGRGLGNQWWRLGQQYEIGNSFAAGIGRDLKAGVVRRELEAGLVKKRERERTASRSVCSGRGATI
ncbi:hypothetical protein M0R45_029402 [Rubus argutus]|uniref:Uncharacterized protein n=1 Tax=Rubus argutus TaxID=59490 RepID=A0AAW1W8W9_RUBAR